LRTFEIDFNSQWIHKCGSLRLDNM